MTRHSGIWWVLSLWPASLVGQEVTPIPREALALVVRIANAVPREDVDFIGGAGIVIGETDRDVIIATAEHVVRAGASGLRVMFEFARGDTVPFVVAKLDTALDVAVILVARNRVKGYRSERFGFDRRGDIRRLKVGDDVRPIGCPAGECWQVPATPDPVINVSGRGVLFESLFTSPGSSGGGLFNAYWELVGMVTQKGDPMARALTIDQVLETVSSWGYRSSIRLRRRPIPRQGYKARFSVALLAPLAENADSLADPSRFPSGRVSLVRRLRTTQFWQATFLRLAPDNLSVRAGMVGGGLILSKGRVAAQPFVEVGLGRVEGRYDAGGYYVASGTGNEYVPLWTQVSNDGIGVGGGLELEFTLARRVILSAMGGYWSFPLPEVPTTARPLELPDFFLGVGLRWGW